MQQNNLVKICPDCSSPNTVNSRRCVNCGKNLAGVQSEPEVQATSAPLDEPLPLPVLPDELEDQKTLSLNESQLAKAPHTPFEDTVSNVRTNLKQRKGGFVILALPIVLLLILVPLVILIPRIKGNGDNPTLLPTAFPTPTQVSLQLPDGLGEAIAADGHPVGVNDGSFAPFDTGRSTQALKQQAAEDMARGNTQGAIAFWQQALSAESNDAESWIYLEDQRVLASGEPYVTLVAGTAFSPPFPGSAYETELQGIYVAQHEFNTENHAFQLRVLIANSGSDVNDTLTVSEQIVRIAQKDPTIVGIVGWLNSSNTTDALAALAKAKIPIISPQASSDVLTGISPYFFRVVAPNKGQAQDAAQFMKNILHVKNPVVFLDHGEVYSQNLAQDFENQFAAGAHLPEETFVTDHTSNFAALIQDALQYHPDAFYFTSSSSADAGHFQDALPTTSPYANIPAMGGDGSYTIHKNGYGRWYFTEYAYHGESTIPIAAQFAQEYTADFDPGPYPQKPTGYYGYSLPDDHAILSYDATEVVLTALEMAEANGKTTFTPQVLADTLPKITGSNAFQGVSGQIAFGSDHDPVNKAIVVLHASKNGYTELYTVQGCFVKGCPAGS